MNHNIKPYQADDVYLHKLVNYKDLFEIIFDNIKFDSVCEIGIETGEFSSILEDYIKDGVIKEYHGVDVCITKKIGFNSHYHEMTSLEYLTSEEHLGHDLYLVDGDHNYYTVTAELENIFSAASGKKSASCMILTGLAAVVTFIIILLRSRRRPLTHYHGIRN
ncbi:hypothetical protein GGER_17720 [Serratia rubidaea]